MPRKIDLAGSSETLQVSVEELQRQVTRYREERYNYLVPTIGGDSRQAWIDRSTLEEFLAGNPGATGVRIYFGVTDVDDPDFKGGAHNLIFVPTQRQQHGDTDLMGDEDCVLVVEKVSGVGLTDAKADICPPPKCPNGSALRTE